MSAPDFDLRAPGSVTPLRDPNLDDTAAEGSPTLLDDIRAELANDVTRGDVTYEVPDRPGWAVTYSADVDFDEMRRREKQCIRHDKLDVPRYMGIMLSLQCRSISRRGQIVTGEDGTPWKFSTVAFQDTLGIKILPDAVAAVRKVYGNDGAIISTWSQLLEAAGYGREVAEADPTVDPSSNGS